MNLDLEDSWILLVDDDTLVRSVGKRLFEASGRRCVTAADHAQAIERLESNPHIGVAILDFRMPDGEAPDLVRKIRLLRPDLLLIGSSGSHDTRTAFAECGVSRFLPKPWVAKQVPALLAAYR
ncbi:MAG: response regulator [Deltaproteobacteria bacterium]|nr:response regulator [Deltaproteobacteria bacterium]